TVGLLVNHALVTREQERTQQALEREKVRAAEAERRLEQSRHLVELLIQIGEEELDDRPPFQSLRKRLLEAALSHYPKLIDETRDDPAGAGFTAARERVRQVLADLVTLQRVDGVMLLSMDTVLDELKPDEEQRETLRELIARLHRDRMDTMFDPDLTL